MRIQVALTGPPRVILGRSLVDLSLPLETCTLQELLDALANAEPRIARYLQAVGGQPTAAFRPLLNDHPLAPDDRIPDGGTVTLLFAVAGGCGLAPR